MAKTIKTKRGRNQDAKLVSTKQTHEVRWFKRKHGAGAKEVRRVIAELEAAAGTEVHSRAVIMAELERQKLVCHDATDGHTINSPGHETGTPQTTGNEQS